MKLSMVIASVVSASAIFFLVYTADAQYSQQFRPQYPQQSRPQYPQQSRPQYPQQSRPQYPPQSRPQNPYDALTPKFGCPPNGVSCTRPIGHICRGHEECSGGKMCCMKICDFECVEPTTFY